MIRTCYLISSSFNAAEFFTTNMFENNLLLARKFIQKYRS